MNTLDLFSLKGRTVVIIGGEGLLGKVVVQTIRDLDGEAISIDIKSGADYVYNITEFSRLHQIATDNHCSGVINCAIGNQRAVAAPDHSLESDLQIGLVGATSVHTAFYETLKKTRGTLLNIGSDLSLGVLESKHSP